MNVLGFRFGFGKKNQVNIEEIFLLLEWGI